MKLIRQPKKIAQVNDFTKIFIFIVVFVRFFIHDANADAINEKLISVFRIPQNAYIKISLSACISRENINNNSLDLDKSINLLLMDLANDIAYLDYIIKKYPNNSEYSKYVLDKIVVGFREGYFRQVKNLQSENLVVSYEDNSHVNLKEIYENIKVNPKNNEDFKMWFTKYFPKN
jgi:hypothetical protein